MNLKKLTIINIIIALFLIAFAFVYPVFNEKIFYSNKSQEAKSITEQIAKLQNINYASSNQYISITKHDEKSLVLKFNINQNDIQYYDYSIYTTFNSYTLYAEPKIKYLRTREISPKIYVYSKKLNQEAKIKWQ